MTTLSNSTLLFSLAIALLPIQSQALDVTIRHHAEPPNPNTSFLLGYRQLAPEDRELCVHNRRIRPAGRQAGRDSGDHAGRQYLGGLGRDLRQPELRGIRCVGHWDRQDPAAERGTPDRQMADCGCRDDIGNWGGPILFTAAASANKTYFPEFFQIFRFQTCRCSHPCLMNHCEFLLAGISRIAMNFC